MLDGVVEQLEEAQKNGIWAWDVELHELVLVIPEVLALLGDNPMQSEFACHIGLRGKLFCRACWVKGSDSEMDGSTEKEPPGNQSEGGATNVSEAGSETGNNGDAAGSKDDTTGGTESPSEVPKRGRVKKVLETMGQMVNRVTSFLQISRLRTRAETTQMLRSYFTEASTLDAKTKVKKMRTDSGIKDTFQLHFIEKIFNSYRTLRGQSSKQAALDAELSKLPEDIMSPVLDPHQDTPVEILHVILLGFVKYLWRDLIQNQLKNKEDKKVLLATRLTSFDVAGFGISPLAGRTLVQYSGSLTGRDFRAIAQAAPFVVYDLVSKDCLDTWVALSKLIPLIWQPEIADVERHITLLQKEINYFLLCTARWTNRLNSPEYSWPNGTCTSDGRAAKPFLQTLTGKQRPDYLPANHPPTFLATNKSLVLFNGVTCSVGGYLIVRDAQSPTHTFVACVEEIFQRRGSSAHLSGTLMRCKLLVSRISSVPSTRSTIVLQLSVALQDISPFTRNASVPSKPMRDAVFLQKFRSSSEELDFYSIIHQSAAAEIDKQRSA
ncbi:hypothetical protein DXG03_002007 [Asterophora parasitica]|uniref:Uncharacterized protein n=1 Tax=Asterophora parasitica TaxID=117018 RepID=A0A9P7G8Y4_9AGAR|nr:hypothetical protein DXG03_002007 [Asterophora parasitica]